MIGNYFDGGLGRVLEEANIGVNGAAEVRAKSSETGFCCLLGVFFGSIDSFKQPQHWILEQ